MNIFMQNKLKACVIHLLCCVLIAIPTLGLVFGHWYATPFDKALGVETVFLMLLVIDIILGPLLTLVVYKANKPSLKFDLAVIACLQLAALIYGLHAISTARPVYMVFTKDRFDLILAHEVATVSGTAEKPGFTVQSPWAQPLLDYQVAAARIPNSATDYPWLNLLTQSAMSGGFDIPNVLNYHVPYESKLNDIRKLALPLSDLVSSDPRKQASINAWRAKYPADSVVLPLKIKFTIYTVVLNLGNGAVLGIEPVDVF